MWPHAAGVYAWPNASQAGPVFPGRGVVLSKNLDLGFPSRDPPKADPPRIEESDALPLDAVDVPVNIGLGADIELGADIRMEDAPVDTAESAALYAPVQDSPSRAAPSHPPGTAVRPPKPPRIRVARKTRARSPKLPRLQVAGGVLALLTVVGGGVALATGVLVVEVSVVMPSWGAVGVDPPTGPQPDTPVMSHMLVIDTWRTAETPTVMSAALRGRMPDLLTFVSAVSSEGEDGLRYALVVGPAYSSVEAERLRVPVAVAFELLNPDPTSWAVQEASYAFLLGEYATLEEAAVRVVELALLGVPAYVLRVAYPDGPPALRVYGGAFGDEEQARPMARLLREAGLSESPLTERRGELPS